MHREGTHFDSVFVIQPLPMGGEPGQGGEIYLRRIPQALLIHAWGFPSDGWNLPSWSLSALIVCYALFPSFWRAVSKIRHAWLLPLLGLVILAAFEVLAETVFDQGLADLRFQFGVVRALPLFEGRADQRRLLLVGMTSCDNAARDQGLSGWTTRRQAARRRWWRSWSAMAATSRSPPPRARPMRWRCAARAMRR